MGHGRACYRKQNDEKHRCDAPEGGIDPRYSVTPAKIIDTTWCKILVGLVYESGFRNDALPVLDFAHAHDLPRLRRRSQREAWRVRFTIGSGAAWCVAGVVTGGVMVEVEATMLNTIDMITRTARIPNMMRALR